MYSGFGAPPPPGFGTFAPVPSTMGGSGFNQFPTTGFNPPPTTGFNLPPGNGFGQDTAPFGAPNPAFGATNPSPSVFGTLPPVFGATAAAPNPPRPSFGQFGAPSHAVVPFGSTTLAVDQPFVEHGFPSFRGGRGGGITRGGRGGGFARGGGIFPGPSQRLNPAATPFQPQPFLTAPNFPPSLPAAAAVVPKRSLFIPNTSLQYTLESIREYLQSSFGPVESITAKPTLANPLKFFVKMSKVEDAERVVNANSQHLIPGLFVNFDQYAKEENDFHIPLSIQPSEVPMVAPTAAAVVAAPAPNLQVAAATAANKRKKEELQQLIAEKERDRKKKSLASLPPPVPSFLEENKQPHAHASSQQQQQRESYVVGTCELMCPRSDTQNRLESLDALEQFPGEDVFETSMKKFQRSAAAEVMDTPEEIRTVQALVRSVHHLWYRIVDCDKERASVNNVQVISFTVDRIKRIKQEIELQGLTALLNPQMIPLLEQIVRFLVLVSFELCEKKTDEDMFSQKINREEINSTCLKLFAMYDQGLVSPYEGEMRAYYVLLLMNSNDRFSANTFVNKSQGQPKHALLDLALQVYRAHLAGDYTFIFTVYRTTTEYLFAILLHAQLNLVRKVAIELINGLFYEKAEVRFPVERLQTLCCFDTQEQCLAFLDAANVVQVDANGILFGVQKPLDHYVLPDVQFSPLVESKRGAKTLRRDVVLGNEVPTQSEKKLRVSPVAEKESGDGIQRLDVEREQQRLLAAAQAEENRKQQALMEAAKAEQERRSQMQEKERQEKQQLEEQQHRLFIEQKRLREEQEERSRRLMAQKHLEEQRQREEEARARQRALHQQEAVERVFSMLDHREIVRVTRLRFQQWKALAKQYDQANEYKVHECKKKHKLVVFRQWQQRVRQIQSQRILLSRRFPLAFDSRNRNPSLSPRNSEPLWFERPPNTLELSPMVKERLSLIRFDSSKAFDSQAMFGAWCVRNLVANPETQQIFPNELFRVPEPLKCEGALVIWNCKSKREQDQLNVLLPTSCPTVYFDFSNQGEEGKWVAASKRSMVWMGNLPSLSLEMMQQGLEWLSTRVLSECEKTIPLSEYCARMFPRLTSVTHVQSWLREGNHHIFSCGVQVPTYLNVKEFALNELGMTEMQCDEIVAVSLGDTVWLWEQLVWMYFKSVGGREWFSWKEKVNGNDTLWEARNNLPRSFQDEVVVPSADMLFEAKLKAYVSSPAKSRVEGKSMVAFSPSIPPAHKEVPVVARDFVLERMKQEQLVRRQQIQVFEELEGNW